MPKPAQEVLAQLQELTRLPAGEWRVHPSDMAHGEDRSLDDSSWPIAKPGSSYPEAAIWFRQSVEVPKLYHGYDLTGARLWFAFSAGASVAPNEIIYVNGRRVAMGESLEPVLLADHIRAGDRLLIAVKVLATLGQKKFNRSTITIEAAPGRPSPGNLRSEILSAAFLMPSFSRNLAADQATVSKAAQMVDLTALSTGDQTRFDASMRAAETSLATLKPLLQEATMHLTGNSHIDAAWLWPWTETVDVVKRTFGTALQLMDEYPTFTYTQSAAQYNDWLAQKYPQINDEIKKRIQEGRWEIVGGMWVEPDLNMPDGESIARSILIGKRWYQKEYGVDVKIGWNPDSFGYNWQLPQIYKKSGIDYFVTQKMSWNDTNQLPLKLFWWESPDGSKVLTYFPHGYSNSDLSPSRLSANLAVAREQAPGLPEMMDLYGVGDHGGGPTRAMLDEALHWMEPNVDAPKFEFGTATSYFARVQPKIAAASPQWDYKTIAAGYKALPVTDGQISIPTWNDELYLEFHRGVFTTQAAHKRNMRESSAWALNAEKVASLAWLDGNAYPGGELTEAWKKITFNQFHDLAAGSGISVIYKDAQKDYDDVRWATDEISQKALNTIAAQVNTSGSGGVPLFVFNPLAWKRSGIVTVDVQMPVESRDVAVMDGNNRVLPSQVLSADAATHIFHLLVDARDTPSMGYQVLHVLPEKHDSPTDLHVSGTTIENASLRVVVDSKSGCITSLYDKKSNFETLAPEACGNVLQAFVDKPKQFDAWNIDPGTLDKKPTELMTAESVQVIEKGPMRGVIRVTHTWQHSKFVQDIELYSGSDEVIVVNDFDWHERHILLKAAFPLAATAPVATYEIPFGTIQRPTTRNNTWEKARFEVPALRWADLGDGKHGFSLINDSKYGYDAVGNVLRLSLLRAPTAPDPEADQGHHHFSYALYPHAGNWVQAMSVRHGLEFNDNLIAMQVEQHTGSMAAEHSFVSLSQDNLVVTAMKKAEDSNAIVFHMYEWAGKQGDVVLTVPPGGVSAAETNLMESSQDPLKMTGDQVTVATHPYEILAVQVNYPHQ